MAKQSTKAPREITAEEQAEIDRTTTEYRPYRRASQLGLEAGELGPEQDARFVARKNYRRELREGKMIHQAKSPQYNPTAGVTGPAAMTSVIETENMVLMVQHTKTREERDEVFRQRCVRQQAGRALHDASQQDATTNRKLGGWGATQSYQLDEDGQAIAGGEVSKGKVWSDKDSPSNDPKDQTDPA